ncbi:hypothetical protein ACFQZF_04110 [Flavobacterium myungsuense]|uniref:hypothetical protein n=1 Tax=Flavobacterium myungsuense TaxID=651823 RepID=UPI00362B6766
MINTDFKSISEIIKAFPNEQACLNHLETLKWNGIVVSPFDANSKVYVCKKTDTVAELQANTLMQKTTLFFTILKLNYRNGL